ncbi:MAG TPA: GTP-binding protein [Thermomicrobiales bacterium]|jgi:G3E family GTPase|nr:GTP-binding protein [Thermomicrobiales bacterium]
MHDSGSGPSDEAIINDMAPLSIPVTVIAGFAGAGKSTVLAHLLAARPASRYATIVNDLAEPAGPAPDSARDESSAVIELTGACACCTAQDDLIAAVTHLAARGDFDGIMIETAAVAQPSAIAMALQDETLSGRIHLGNLVTVVDASTFWDDYEREHTIPDEDGNGSVVSPLAPLLVEQIEAANVILINRSAVADQERLAELDAYVRHLNPEAEVRQTIDGTVDADWLLGRDRYTEAELAPHPEPAPSEADVYPESSGFTSFAYVVERPMLWDAFVANLDEWPDEVMRSRGFVVFADHPPVLLSMVRDTVELTILADDHDHDHDHEDHGIGDIVDRTEMIFVGRDMPAELIVARFDACLAPENTPPYHAHG